MSLARTEQRALAELDGRLSRSDPWLAEAFAHLPDDVGLFPACERLPRRLKLADLDRTAILAVVSVLVFIVCVVAAAMTVPSG